MSTSSDPGLGKGRLSCFHGEMRPPIDEASLFNFVKIAGDIDRVYQEAMSRLPLQEIPDLVGCIQAGGLSIGLADPVTNVILNAIALLPGDGEQPPPSQTKEQSPPSQPKTFGWSQIATQSYAGLCTFMTAYFRYLSSTQARRFLYLAAIKLVWYDRLLPSKERCLLPDGGLIKAALRAAALQAEHPAPDVLAGLMTAQYPTHILSHTFVKMRYNKMFSPYDVWEVRDMLARQWPPNPPPANIEFRCRPNDITCRRLQDGWLLLKNCLNLEDGFVAQVMVSKSIQNDNDVQYLSERMLNDSELDRWLYTFHINPVVQSRLRQQDDVMEIDYDDHPCDYMLFLKTSLLDTIYAFYIEALARLPSSTPSPRLIRALLVAGHCYGPLDPVSNIILSTMWYDITFGVDVESPQGILSTKPLSRMVSCSLAGLVAITRLSCKTEHEALYHINFLGCDLSAMGRSTYLGRVDPLSTPETALNMNKLFDVAAKAAKHPQQAAFVSFLVSISSNKLTNYLQDLLHRSGGRILDAEWDLLNKFLRKKSAPHVAAMPAQKDKEAPHCMFFASLDMFHPSASPVMSTEMPAFRDRLHLVRTELNKVLREYCYQHPWEPTYQLHIICGVMESSKSSYHDDSKLYHANFLANKGDATLSQPEATLFFAEFWCPPLSEAVQLKPSSCRPIKERSYIGRCSVCETKGSMILHPPSGGHSGDIEGPIDIYPRVVHEGLTVGYEDWLESDIYYDPNRYVQPGNDLPVVPWTPKVQPSVRHKRQRREMNDHRWRQELPRALF